MFKILNIHGYKGSPNNSAYQALLANKYDVISEKVDYDKLSPTQVYKYLYGLAKIHNVDAVVGTSLGGFFALILSTELNIPTITINPAILPGVYLPRLGYKYPGGVRDFLSLSAKLGDLDRRYLSTIVGTDDEIIDTPEYTKAVLGNSRYIEVDKGRHSGSTLNLTQIFKQRGQEFINDLLMQDFM